MPILVVVDDLMFTSKIKAAAGALGLTLVSARSPEDILTLARANSPALAIFDLNHRKLDAVQAIRNLKAMQPVHPIPVVAFVSHVQTDLIDAARAAGADQVLPRSTFTTRLAEILETGRDDPHA